MLAAPAHLEEEHTAGAIVLDDTVPGFSGAVLTIRDDGRLELMTEGTVVAEPIDPQPEVGLD